MLGVAGGGALLAQRAAGAAGATTPEGEIGPYFADDSAAAFNRSNILANIDGTNTQHGVPLKLSLYVRDARRRCAAVRGAQLDIWHCNAYGVYSDESVENTSGQTWLRGYQLTDSKGLVTFRTIVPGWYPGRTTHIHLRVRSSYSQASSPSDGSNTTQLFFAQSAVDALNTGVPPYRSRGTNPTTNANDHVYTAQTKGVTLLSLTGTTARGFAATFTIDLPITG